MKVWFVRSSASWRFADRHLQVAVDAVEMDEVELLERFAVAVLGALDEPADARPQSVASSLRHRGASTLRARQPKPMCVSRDPISAAQ